MKNYLIYLFSCLLILAAACSRSPDDESLKLALSPAFSPVSHTISLNEGEALEFGLFPDSMAGAFAQDFGSFLPFGQGRIGVIVEIDPIKIVGIKNDTYEAGQFAGELVELKSNNGLVCMRATESNFCICLSPVGDCNKIYVIREGDKYHARLKHGCVGIPCP